MRVFTCTLFALITNLITYGQLTGYEFQTPISISSYTETKKNCEFLYIHTKFAKSELSLPTTYNIFSGTEIIAIDLVYTDYPSGNPFYELNRNRFISLGKILAGINLNNIPVHLYRQNKAIDRKEAEKDFHGFVIYFKKISTEPIVKIIIDPTEKSLSDSLSKISLSPKISKDSNQITTFISDGDFIQKIINSDFNSDSLRQIKDAYLNPIDSTTRSYILCYDEKLKAELKKDKTSKVKIYSKEEMIEKGLINKYNRRYYRDCNDFFYITSIVKLGSPIVRFFTSDSTVEKVLNRNQWSKMMVCADVTSSMTPHILQLLVWLKLNANNRTMRYFTAFNDGDSTPDKAKKIGNTGGIYSTDSWNYIDIAKTVCKGVNGGTGGDVAENVIEGLLDGQKNSADCENYVLIADNNAPVKDIALLKKINKPIKIVLCGVISTINVDYLNIARKTGGSVHTIEDDITNLAFMKEGEIFEFKGRQYKIRGGNFFDITFSKTNL